MIAHPPSGLTKTEWTDADFEQMGRHAPATLVFDQAWDITGDFGPLHEILEIADVHRLDPPDGRADPLWHIKGHSFDLRLRSGGYHQYVRQPPRHVPGQLLTMAQRGGLAPLRLTSGQRQTAPTAESSRW